jgi:hypothetical protein
MYSNYYNSKGGDKDNGKNIKIPSYCYEIHSCHQDVEAGY